MSITLRENKFVFSTVIIREVDGYSGLCLDLDVGSELRQAQLAVEELNEML